jgi:hypothetical protein
MAGAKNKRALHLARQEAARNAEGVRLDIDPADALQEVLDRAVSMLRFAGSKADELPESDVMVNTAFGPMLNAWARLETDLRQEVGALASRMVQIGIADRAVRVQEAKAALLVQAIMAAARDAGIPRDKVRALGPALRTQLAALEGGTTDAEPRPVAA